MRDPSSAMLSGPDSLADLGQRCAGAGCALVATANRLIRAEQPQNLSPAECMLVSEVEELGRIITEAKAELAALSAEDIKTSHIPAATDELDAVVAHTAAATDSILEVCETLDSLGNRFENPQVASDIQAATTRIYEACSFQDITGQRIAKVVATLKSVEAKVAQMVAAFSPSRAPASALEPLPETLLNGPQLPAQAMDQGDIDRLLAGFG